MKPFLALATRPKTCKRSVSRTCGWVAGHTEVIGRVDRLRGAKGIQTSLRARRVTARGLEQP